MSSLLAEAAAARPTSATASPTSPAKGSSISPRHMHGTVPSASLLEEPQAQRAREPLGQGWAQSPGARPQLGALPPACQLLHPHGFSWGLTQEGLPGLTQGQA